MTCTHESFAARVEVQRLCDDAGDVRNFVAEVQVRCAQCDEPFHFLVRDTGFSFTYPTVNVGATTMHVPIAPGEAAPPTRIRFDVGS